MTSSLRLAIISLLLGAGAAAASPELLGVSYRADVPFPQFMPFWREAWSLKDAVTGDTVQYARQGMPVGGSLHVFLRNGGEEPVEIDDVLLEDVSLRRAIAFSEQIRKREFHPAGIAFGDITGNERRRLEAAGDPIWWRVRPSPVPPGGTAEAMVRLRRTPERRGARLAIRWGDETRPIPIRVRPGRARMAGVSFSPELDRIYVYVQPGDSSPGGRVRVLLDGRDVTEESSSGIDAACDVVPVVIRLSQALQPGSFHVLSIRLGTAAPAIVGIRAWSDDFCYGIWGYGKAGDEEGIRRFLTDWTTHNINVHMGMAGGELREYLETPAGRQFCASRGLRPMTKTPGTADAPFAYFLMDEPDCADYRVEEVEPHKRVGAMAQALVDRSRSLRASDGGTPHYLNVDLTYKPDNWYIYGQLPDILAADPYYQERLRSAYWEHPDRLPLYAKATYVHAVGTVCQSACAPNPLHLILNSVRHTTPERRFRYATAEEKRIEAYYAVAAGAKGLSYWWYTPIGQYMGCGSDDPQAAPLWREIGLLGAELRTCGPILVRSCPASIPVTASRRVWTRCLLAGLDTLVLICVNDDYASDRFGTVVQPVEDAQVTVTLPSWLRARDLFEINSAGTHDIGSNVADRGLTLGLGRLDLTRLILITSDPTLRGRLQALYDQHFAANTNQLLVGK